MMAAGAISCTSSAVMSHGTISEYTCKSRTRRAISCRTARRSRTRRLSGWWNWTMRCSLEGSFFGCIMLPAALAAHFCLRICISDCTVSCANPYLSAVHLQYNATQGPCYRLRFALPISNAGKENVRPLWFIWPCAGSRCAWRFAASTISNPCGIAGLSGPRSRVKGHRKAKYDSSKR